MFKQREITIFSIVVIGIVVLTLLQINEIDLIFAVGEFFLYLIFACTFLYALYKFFKNRKPVSFFIKIKPLLFGSLSIAFFIVLSYFIDTEGGKKEMIVGGTEHDIGFIHFQLFSDNTFKVINSGPFGGPIYRGSFSLVNDTLMLNNPSLKYLYPTLTLILKEGSDKRRYFQSVDTTGSKRQLFIQMKDFNSDHVGAF